MCFINGLLKVCHRIKKKFLNMFDLGSEEGPRSKSAGPRSPPSENTKLTKQSNNYIGHRSSMSENTKMTLVPGPNRE